MARETPFSQKCTCILCERTASPEGGRNGSDPAVSPATDHYDPIGLHSLDPGHIHPLTVRTEHGRIIIFTRNWSRYEHYLHEKVTEVIRKVHRISTVQYKLGYTIFTRNSDASVAFLFFGPLFTLNCAVLKSLTLMHQISLRFEPAAQLWVQPQMSQEPQVASCGGRGHPSSPDGALLPSIRPSVATAAPSASSRRRRT